MINHISKILSLALGAALLSNSMYPMMLQISPGGQTHSVVSSGGTLILSSLKSGGKTHSMVSSGGTKMVIKQSRGKTEMIIDQSARSNTGMKIVLVSSVLVGLGYLLYKAYQSWGDDSTSSNPSFFRPPAEKEITYSPAPQPAPFVPQPLPQTNPELGPNVLPQSANFPASFTPENQG